MGKEKSEFPTKVNRSNFKLLTDHQAKMAFMICEEKTVAQISKKFKITEKTFFNTRTIILKKLALKTTVGLVKYIYKYRYLKL
jgi:DNA-binding CsgD family transcriptional regulator